MKPVFLLLILILSLLINPAYTQEAKYKTTGNVERIDPALDAIMDTTVKAEIIAEGFVWSEGPLWVENEQMLLFSDVPKNTVYKWTEEGGTEVYLRPSGYTGTQPSKSKEPGSNGLLLDTGGNLVLCQHGNRQMVRMEAPLTKPEPVFHSLADNYKGKRFNSPNDAVYSSNGDLFFTDPPYGLPMQNDKDPAKEIGFNGVYKVRPNGEVVLLTGNITRPNGIALFPGETKLLVACSDRDAPGWYLLDINDAQKEPVVFYDATDQRKGLKGSPDGLKIDKKGNIYASGPGGIWIFDKAGKVLGKIRLDESASNVALSDDEKTLYVTNDMYVLRVRLR
ncbi:SMP-30/gluconolactonase/LRE family protein [Sinomicrobium pectinilyticum]|uniref:SMP-30/gluconolactonase/LRE family protein n=1 Tax=Sinomicrobium pectinilyticum TaxID=1084421 RepID=A0A3N0DQC4_SINP1|nr:SMP-30/gluconolactonase/LRE family protein [Sinomicrobium pectinilyticum]RNL77840.1 SMP-30/gluconolactonase/LRE family protein [Sinomicrobium pectinilyticum]